MSKPGRLGALPAAAGVAAAMAVFGAGAAAADAAGPTITVAGVHTQPVT